MTTNPHNRLDPSQISPDELEAYEKQRDTKRRAALDRLMKAADEAGLYDATYTGDQ